MHWYSNELLKLKLIGIYNIIKNINNIIFNLYYFNYIMKYIYIKLWTYVYIIHIMYGQIILNITYYMQYTEKLLYLASFVSVLSSLWIKTKINWL